MPKIGVLLLLLGSMAARPAGAQADTLIVAAHISSGRPDAVGHGASLDWLRVSPSSRLVGIGVAQHAVGASHWTLARGLTAWSLTPNVRASVAADAGAGRAAGEAFGYFALRAGAGGALAAGRLGLEAEAQYLDIGASEGAVARATATVVPVPSLLIAIGGLASSRSLGVHAASGRVEHKGPRGAVFAGGAWGRSSATLQGVGVDSHTIPMRELFAGVTLSVTRVPLTMVLGELELGGALRRSLSVHARLPL